MFARKSFFILCEMSLVPLKISCKISYPYIERSVFGWEWIIEELSQIYEPVSAFKTSPQFLFKIHVRDIY